ncbi:hypothetical protein LTR53_004666 [Teratosphaeriaceae sp. CCFEE 6253]|nr:hypothetical protein LTR53_004666 [Teratosphaeriaceae sp. CCFEE 6253]
MAGRAYRSRVVKPGHRPDRLGASRQQMSAPIPPAQAPKRRTWSPANSKARLRVGMDYGTSTLSCAVVVVKSGDEPTPDHIHTVHFSEKNHFAPQQVAWDSEGNFYSGYEVNTALDKGMLNPSQVIDMWKMLLYKGHADSAIASRIRERLGDRSLDTLMTTHFRAILLQVKQCVKGNMLFSNDTTNQEIDAMPIDLFLSVPQMWKPPANKKLTDAAHAAGVAHVELVPEPQCAAAYFTSHIRHKLPALLTKGDVLIVADVGRGTGDFVSVAYQSVLDDGAKALLRTVCEPKGEMCGSQFVDENFLQYLREVAVELVGEGGLDELFESYLGITTAEGLREANIKFENLKQDFTPSARPMHVIISGIEGAEWPEWLIKIESGLMIEFFEPVIQEVFSCIDYQIRGIEKEHLTAKALIIPGGFGRSEYFLARMREQYEDIQILGQQSDAVGSYLPVARGGLYRHTHIKARAPPSEGSFIIGQIEVFDPEKHPDALRPSKNGDSSSASDSRQPNVKIVNQDDCDHGIYNVHDRCEFLLKKGEIKKDGKAFTTQWQQFYAHPDEKVIYQQIYYTEADMQTSDPLLKKGKAADMPGAELHAYVEPWGNRLTFPIHDLAKRGYELQVSDSGPVYELCYRLKLVCDGVNIKVSFQLAKDADELFQDEEFSKSAAEKARLWEENVHDIVAATHNPVPCTEPS